MGFPDHSIDFGFLCSFLLLEGVGMLRLGGGIFCNGDWWNIERGISEFQVQWFRWESSA